MKKLYFAVLSVLAGLTATAQDSPLTLSGYVDTYYFANLNGTTGLGGNLGASGFERIFDQNSNSFQVGMAQVKATYELGSVTGVMDLTFGNHGDLGNYGNKFSPLGAGIGTTGLAIKQAYLSWAMNDALTFTAGQFGTNVGYEVIDAPVNYNYSLSNLFGNGPFYHTGVKLDIAASDNLGFMIGVNNGLDSKDDFNKAKGIMAQISATPVENWSLYLNYFGTNEGTKEEPAKYSWYDITTSYQVTDNFLIGVNAVPYGALSDGTTTKSWWGAALYLNAGLTDKFGLGLRAERFDNSEGGIYLIDENGDGTSVTSLTLTANVDITENLMFKPEIRYDGYTPTSGFQLTDGDGAGKNSQTTIGAAMIFHF